MDFTAARPSKTGDEAALKEIWKVAFGDDDEFIDRFLKEVYTPGMASVAEMDGNVVSAIYLFRGTSLVMPDGRAIPAPYCYTLGTLREYRGHGLGAAVSEHIMRSAMESAPLVALVPAESSLYGWYAATFGLYPISELREAETEVSGLGEFCGKTRVHRVDAESYGKLRELMLKGHCHVRFSETLLEWYDHYIRADGGGLYLLDIDGSAGCAACEKSGDKLLIKELLLPHGSYVGALHALTDELSCTELTVRTPVFFSGEGQVRDCAVARLADGFSLPEKSSIWWGLAFD